MGTVQVSMRTIRVSFSDAIIRKIERDMRLRIKLQQPTLADAILARILAAVGRSEAAIQLFTLQDSATAPPDPET